MVPSAEGPWYSFGPPGKLTTSVDPLAALSPLLAAPLDGALAPAVAVALPSEGATPEAELSVGAAGVAVAAAEMMALAWDGVMVCVVTLVSFVALLVRGS